jgi:hypothetical protein
MGVRVRIFTLLICLGALPCGPVSAQSNYDELDPKNVSADFRRGNVHFDLQCQRRSAARTGP